VELQAQAPDTAGQFDENHANSTRGHFLNGANEVCIRGGRRNPVFLKQAGVMFIEQMITNGPHALSLHHTALLRQAVAYPDSAESDFAPHEAPKASRQLCIVDIKARLSFDRKAARKNRQTQPELRL